MCLPFKSSVDTSYPSKDIIDEAIVFYAHIMEADDYPIEGAADKTLIYLFLFMTECLRQCLYVKDLETAKNKLIKLVDGKTLPVPGDVGFPFNKDFGSPKNDFEEYLLRSYLMQLERECLDRFLDIVFRAPEKPDHDPLEYYLSFATKPCLGGRLKLDL
uniref:Actin-related protein 2/3 complex subunit 3 n=1 Tax=Panagrolaimus sp. PS1159 TaxID=55785 RepID=A0AC35FYC9_9BILA